MEKQLISKAEDIELNEKDEIQNMLGDPPGWILKSGITIVFFSVIAMLFISYMIEYPDTIQTRVTFTTDQPPIRVFSKSTGKITEFLVDKNQSVAKGDLLMVMENSANWKDILALEKLVTRLDKTNSISSLAKINIPKNWELGSLQNPYSSLTQNLKDIVYYDNQDITEKKIETLREQIINIRALTESLKRQKGTLKKESDLAIVNLNRYKSLFQEGGASKVELEQKEAIVLQFERQFENMESSIINNNIQIDQLESQILEIRQSKNDNHSSKSLTLSEDIQRLKSEIAKWKLTYLIDAPVAGKISLSIPRNKNENINPSDELMVIVPEEENNGIIIYASLPMSGSGKVEKDMPAHITLDGYPQQEFGTLKAAVESMSLIPKDNSISGQGEENTYLLTLALSDSLNTSYKKTIPFKQEMQGSAKIITKNKRVLERIFEQFYDLMNKELT